MCRMTVKLVIAVAAFCSSAVGFAATIGISARTGIGGLNGNDFVDWGTKGADLAAVPNPFSVNSFMGQTLTVSMPAGSFQRRNQGANWPGNFAPGDRLLWTQNNAGPVAVFDFDALIQGAGAQIQADSLGAFTATIQAFDSLNNSLGLFSFNGNSTLTSGDNSAIFIGIQSTLTDIKRIEFNVSVPPGGDFGLNQMDLLVGPAVPLPAAVWGGAALMGLMVARSRRRGSVELGG